MHCTDKELVNLLVADESSTELHAIAQHVELCSECQTRLHTLSGAGRWTNEVVAQLRASGGNCDSSELDPIDELPLAIVDSHAGDGDDAEIEIDPVRLDFLSPPVHPELLGCLGRYDVERVVGAGGMGIVLKGYDSELHRAVAIKVLAPHLAYSAAARRRFAREAQATAAVIHPNVIPIYNVESEGKVPYLVMRYINGQSLQARVDQDGPLAVIDALRIAQQTSAGLAAAHAQGLIHRDVKPANILLDEGIERVVLSDFGLARTVDDASLTHTGIVTGTPHYMSPEQAGGDAIDCRSDLFSLGCVLWFMLTGRPPFRAATAMGVLNRICHDTHHDIRQINGSVPVPLARIIDRLLAKHPDQRCASAQALEQELLEVTRAIQAGQLRLEPQPPVAPPIRRLGRRGALAAAGLAAVCMAVAAMQSDRVPETNHPSAATSTQRQLASPTAPPVSGSQTTPFPSNRRTAMASDVQSLPMASAQALPDGERGDRWHKQADDLQEELRLLEAGDGRAMQSWWEALGRNDSPDVEQLSRDLDALTRDTSSTPPERAQSFGGPAKIAEQLPQY